MSPGLLGSVSVDIERTEVTFYRQIGLGFERVSSEEGLEVLNTRYVRTARREVTNLG